MNKRGSWADFELSKLIEVIIILLYCVALFMIVKTSYESSVMERRMIAADMALVIDTVHAAPGNVIIHYYNNWQGFRVSIEKNQIKISPRSDQILAQEDSKFRFAESKTIPMIYASYFEKGKSEKEFMYFQKTQFGVEPGLNRNLNMQILNRGQFSSPQGTAIKNILIDTLNDKVGSRAKRAEDLTTYFSSVDATTTFNYLDYAKSASERKIGLSNNPDLYLMIESIPGNSGCFVFYSNNQSKSIAIKIASEISNSIPSIAVFDPNDYMLQRAPNRGVRIVVYHNNPNTAEIGRAIVSAIKNA